MKTLNDDLFKYLIKSFLNKIGTIMKIFIIIIIITICVKALICLFNWNISFYDIFTTFLSLTSIVLTIILFDKLILNKKKLLNVMHSENEINKLIKSLKYIRKRVISQSITSNKELNKNIRTLYNVKEYIYSNEYYFLAEEPYKEYIERILTFIENNNNNLVNSNKTPDVYSYDVSVWCNQILIYIESKKENLNE